MLWEDTERTMVHIFNHCYCLFWVNSKGLKAPIVVIIGITRVTFFIAEL